MTRYDSDLTPPGRDRVELLRHDWARVGHETNGSGKDETPYPSGRGFEVVGLTGLETGSLYNQTT